MVYPRGASYRHLAVEEGDRTMGITNSPNKRRASDVNGTMSTVDPPTKRLRCSEGFGNGPNCAYDSQAAQLCDVKEQYLADAARYNHPAVTPAYNQQQQQHKQVGQGMLPKLSFQQYRMKEQLRAYMEEEVRRMRCEQRHRSCGYNYEECSKGDGSSVDGNGDFLRKGFGGSISSMYWVFSAGIPLCIMTYFGVYVGCVVMDKQYEMKYLRKQSLSYRENTLEDEHRMMADMIERAKDDFEMIPVPNQAR
ncbi:hypothetical protein FOL47_008930 [Perkinsus chesapeaki]|uniref:Transmembrane protein n=1 Tax=Perkinsus chesapeaki TaxID=330153 RepID=A0A7J6N1Z6_PERCH|nr:hypothetical protein FOL47_008930 [Perkinsus chesapeaki]